jgi:hypothetical protein
MKKLIKTAFSSPLTATATVFGIIALSTGIWTATAHNIVFGLLAFAIGYANNREEKEAI